MDQHGIPHSLSELNKHSCLLGTLDYWRSRESSDKEENIRVPGRLRYNSEQALVDAVLKGLGIVQLPDYYVDHHLKSGELATLLDNYRVPDEGIWAVYPYLHLSPFITKNKITC